MGHGFISTSLKIFKHYKLKPSFSILKDNKAKDRAGVGDKPPPPNFDRSINPNLIQFLLALLFYSNIADYQNPQPSTLNCSEVGSFLHMFKGK